MKNNDTKKLSFFGLAGSSGAVMHGVSLESTLNAVINYIDGVLIIVAIVLILSDLIPAILKLVKRKK